MPEAASARRHLTTIASAPRPAGGAAEAEARRYCAAELERLGFSVSEQPAEYSALPGRYATPLLGGLAAAGIIAAALLAGGGNGWAALALLVASLAAIALAGIWLARRGILSLPVMRERSSNLVANRGAPSLWLFAHLDSKSQPVPIALRAAGLVSLGVAWLAAAVLAVVDARGGSATGAAVPVVIATVFAALPVVMSVVGSRSPGALDNASGVATVLCAVETLPRELPLGVVLTSAEELGLAGARAFAAGHRARGRAINVDTVDDSGAVSLMHSGTDSSPILEALSNAAAARDMPFVARRVVPGILTDGVALADAGWSVVTVSRATLGTLARVHTAADTAKRMTAVGIADTAALIADAVTVLHHKGD